MQILAIDKVPAGVTEEALAPYLPQEVSQTLSLYLEDKIRAFYFRKDRPGVVFIMESASVEEARQVLDKLPLVEENLLDFDLIPVGPLKPLELLLANR